MRLFLTLFGIIAGFIWGAYAFSLHIPLTVEVLGALSIGGNLGTVAYFLGRK